MKILFTTLALAAAFSLQALSAQTLDKSITARFDAATVRTLYPIVRSTTLSAEQQAELAGLLQNENSRFTELLSQDNGLLTSKSEAEIDRLRDAAIRKVLTQEQLLQYFRKQVDAQARARGKEVQKIVGEQLDLSYMELKYISNTFFKIEQEHLVAKLLYKDSPAKARTEAQRIYDQQIAQLEKKSGIRVDKNLKATRIRTLTDYAPVTE